MFETRKKLQKQLRWHEHDQERLLHENNDLLDENHGLMITKQELESKNRELRNKLEIATVPEEVYANYEELGGVAIWWDEKHYTLVGKELLRHLLVDHLKYDVFTLEIFTTTTT